MAADRLTAVLDATYTCLSRYGVRRTTVDDIAGEMGVSRSAVYQYVRGKDDAVRRLTRRLHDRALERAAAAAASDAPHAERIQGILAAKLDLVLDLVGGSPHTAELLDAKARLSGDICDAFTGRIRELLIEQFVAAWSAGQPAAEQSVGQPVAARSVRQTTTPQSVGQPTAPQSVGQPTTPQSVGQPTTPQSVGQPTAPQSVGQSAAPRPDDLARARPARPAPADAADICVALVVGLESHPDAARLLRPATASLLAGLLPAPERQP